MNVQFGLLKRIQNGFLIDNSFCELTDNDKGIINKAVVNTYNYFVLVKTILSTEYKEKMLTIINCKKHVQNSYEKNFLEIL